MRPRDRKPESEGPDPTRMGPDGQPLHFHYHREERLAMPSAASFQKISEHRLLNRKKSRRRLGLFYLPILAVMILLVVIRTRGGDDGHTLDGYSLTLKTEATGDLVYASLVVLKVRATSQPPDAQVRAVFSNSQGGESPVLTRPLPRKNGEVEVINTLFSDPEVREVTVTVTIGEKSLTLTGKVEAPSR